MAIAAVLIISYVTLFAIVVLATMFVLGLGLNPYGESVYSTAGDELLQASSAAAVLGFFVVPALLAVFGRSGPWLRLLAKHARRLAVAFGAVGLVYTGLTAAGTVEPASAIRPATAPLAIVGLAGLALLGLLSSGTVLVIVERLVEEIVRMRYLVSRLSGAKQNIAAIELHLTPTKRIRQKSDERVAQEEALRFQRFARAIASMNLITEFKMSFRGRRGKVLLLARGRKDRLLIEQDLLSVARTYLPETLPVPAPVTNDVGPSHFILLAGAPELEPNPLEPLARFFIENGFEGDYAVVFRRRIGNPVSGLIARRRQHEMSKRAGQQRGSSSLTGDQNTVSIQDHFFQTELEEAVKRVERHSSRQAIDVWMYVAGRGNSRSEALEVAEHAARVARSALSSHRKSAELKLFPQRRPFRDLFPSGRASVMLSSEAAPFVWIPQMAIGVEVAPSVEFELPPPLEGEINLGVVVLPSGNSAHEVRLPLDDLTTHVYITGRTGSGKTTTTSNLCLQLYDHGVPFLVIEPVKTEYRRLAAHVKSLQVFTPGEDVAPFRLNIFEPPPGVSVKTHLDSLEAAWNSSFTMYAPLQYVIKQVLVETYLSCGWDLRSDKRGRPITLYDFRRAAEFVSRKLGYEPNITMNIESAMKVRIDNLELGKEGDLFNTVASTPLETILRRPTVIELRGISHPEEKAFVSALVLSNLAEYLEAKGHSKSLEHVTIIEEAHRLLPNVSTVKGDPEGADSRKAMVERFGNMLAEVRAYGEGLVVVEQIPTKILPDAIKNTATKIVHRVPASDDRELMAGAMGMTPDQSEVLTALRPGEAIVHLQRHPLPIRMAVPNRMAEAGLVADEMSDAAVKNLMAEFYLKNPLARLPLSTLNDKLQKIVDDEWFRAKFKEGYDEVLARRRPDKMLDLVTKAALGAASGQYEFAEVVQKLLQMATEFYLPFDEKDRGRFPREVMAYMERADRDAKRK